MSTQIGSLPLTGQITPVVEESMLVMLNRNLTKALSIEAILSYPHDEEIGKKKVRITIHTTMRPGEYWSKTTSVGSKSSTFSEKDLAGLGRTQNYLWDKVIIPKAWILFGELEGPKKIPIVIIFSFTFNFGAYSFKKETESHQDFNPQLN